MTERNIEIRRREDPSTLGEKWCYRPDVDIVEDGEAITVHADMPGVAPEGVTVEFENGVLLIRGRADVPGPETSDFIVQEYGYGDFEREVRIHHPVDGDRISAAMEHGVLVVRLPKRGAARTRRIEVRAPGG